MEATHDCATYLLKCIESFAAEPEDHDYVSARVVIEHGQPFVPHTFLDETMRGKKGTCFRTAFRRVKNSHGKLIYCEGFALIDGVDKQWAFVQHAWCMNANREVIEPIFPPEIAKAYFGVPLAWKLVESWGETVNDMGILRPQHIAQLPVNGWKHQFTQ